MSEKAAPYRFAVTLQGPDKRGLGIMEFDACPRESELIVNASSDGGSAAYHVTGVMHWTAPNAMNIAGVLLVESVGDEFNFAEYPSS